MIPKIATCPRSTTEQPTAQSASVGEQMCVNLGLTRFPRAILIAEVDAVAERRMARSPDHEEDAGPRVAEIGASQLDECPSASFVVVRQLEREAIALVFLVPRP